MALLHMATLVPGKLELLSDWLPTQSWCSDATDVEQLGTYRFDDPVGEVGVEAFLLRTGDETLLHVPVTYRGAPVDGADDHLIGTTDHSVLGRRWVYDGCADPVWATTLATTVLTGGTQAELELDDHGSRSVREPSITVLGSGAPGTPVPRITEVSRADDGPVTVIRAEGVELSVVRVIGSEVADRLTLSGRWEGGGPVVLAGVSVGA